MGKADDHIIKTEERKSTLWRNSSYRANTGTGFTTGVLWQAHHILCHHSVDAREFPPADVAFAEACLWITPWDLNDGHNMIGLPLNWQYRTTDGTVPSNLPSHQVDHNTKGGYTPECTDWLKNNVWNNIKDKGKDHQANATNMQGLLKAGSDHFRAQLQKRGARKKGTAHCWDHRFPYPPPGASAAEKASYKQEKKWYFPFSMAEDSKVNERQPGIDWKKVAAALRKAVT
jgi:hypothetical protein